jgi:hypothetical protein
MKFIVFNIKSSNSAVKLELYIDSVSNGNSANGGHWELVGTVTDSGLWTSGDVSGCGYEQSAIIHEGHGTLLMRTDGDTAAYKMVSVREIDPSITSVHSGPALKSRTYGRFVQLRKVLVDGLMGFSKDGSVDASYKLYTLLGKAIKKYSEANKGATNGMLSGYYQVLIAK